MLPAHLERALARIARLLPRGGRARVECIDDTIDDRVALASGAECGGVHCDEHLRLPRFLLGDGGEVVRRLASGKRRADDVEQDRETGAFPEADREEALRPL